MSGGSPRGLLFFGHLNKFTVTVTVLLIPALCVLVRDNIVCIYMCACIHGTTHIYTDIRVQVSLMHVCKTSVSVSVSVYKNATYARG
jgi:hypothetical protein